jgi:hypothetical protein
MHNQVTTQICFAIARGHLATNVFRMPPYPGHVPLPQAVNRSDAGLSANGVSMTVVSSVRHAAALAVVIASVSGCAAVQRPIRDAIHPPGQMDADGSIYPCHGYKADRQACGDAIYNRAHIGQVSIGQTLAEVRTIMGRDAETRSVSTRDGRSVELWGFRTDYDRRITTAIEFVDGKVVAVRQDRA